MSSEWRTHRLQDAGRIVTGKTPKTGMSEYEGSAVPFVTPPDFSGAKWISETVRSISEIGAQSVKGSLIPARSVLVTCIGSDMGKAAITAARCVTNQQINAVVVDHSKFCLEFLYYNLSLRKDEIRSLAGGSAQPILNKTAFGQIAFDAPPLEEQQRISAVVRPFDDRIALLRETNATLEAIAQALFKSWFVDFDPVRAKQQGLAPEGMNDATAALFPDEFEESELGMVPRGWSVRPLPETLDFKEGPGIRNWQYTNSDEGTCFINIRCIQDGDVKLSTANRISDDEANGKYAHFHLLPWDVVVSTSGTLGRSAIIRKEHLPLVLNTSVIRFRPIQGISTFCFTYEYLNSLEFLFKLESMASGSVQKNFGPMHLKQIQVVVPSYNALSAFDDVCCPLFEKIVENRGHIDALTALRDTLLPRLISGKLRLQEAESQLEEAIA